MNGARGLWGLGISLYSYLLACFHYRLLVLLGAGSRRGRGDFSGFSWHFSVFLLQPQCWVGLVCLSLMGGAFSDVLVQWRSWWDIFSTSVHWAHRDWFEHCWERTFKIYWCFFGKTSIFCRVIFEDCSSDPIPCWKALWHTPWPSGQRLWALQSPASHPDLPSVIWVLSVSLAPHHQFWGPMSCFLCIARDEIVPACSMGLATVLNGWGLSASLESPYLPDVQQTDSCPASSFMHRCPREAFLGIPQVWGGASLLCPQPCLSVLAQSLQY